jgi:hypothetical protein
MTITYNTYDLEYFEVVGLQKRTPIIDSKNSDNVIIKIPNFVEYRELFKSDYGDITITHDSVNYYYTIQSAPKVTQKEITITASPTIYVDMQTEMSVLYGVYETNPITIVKAILTTYSIDYDNYSFSIAEQYFANTNVLFEAVFAPDFMNAKIFDFVDAILIRCSCSMILDISEKKVYLFDYLDDNPTAFDCIDTNYIGNDRNESDGDVYYTGYQLTVVEYDAVTGYTTKKTARSVAIQYAYEWTDGVSTLYVYQGHLTYTNTGVGQPATLNIAQYDSVNDLYIASGTIGSFTGNSSVYSAGLDVDLSKKATLSEMKYKKGNIWQDNTGSYESGCIRMNDLEGAFEIGNLIIRRGWRKKKNVSFTYFAELPVEVGTFVEYNSKTYYILQKKLLKNLKTYDIVIEEYIK